MERIDSGAFFSRPTGRREAGGKKNKTRKSDAAPPSFLGALSSVEEAEKGEASGNVTEDRQAAAAEEAQALLDEVHQRGDQLKREMTLQALERYKRAVQAFLGCVVEHGVAVQESTSGAHVANRKRFTLVSVVNTKLERLAAGMMATQRDQLEILARVAEINGMLVDLLH